MHGKFRVNFQINVRDLAYIKGIEFYVYSQINVTFCFTISLVHIKHQKLKLIKSQIIISLQLPIGLIPIKLGFIMIMEYI